MEKCSKSFWKLNQARYLFTISLSPLFKKLCLMRRIMLSIQEVTRQIRRLQLLTWLSVALRLKRRLRYFCLYRISTQLKTLKISLSSFFAILSTVFFCTFRSGHWSNLEHSRWETCLFVPSVHQHMGQIASTSVLFRLGRHLATTVAWCPAPDSLPIFPDSMEALG